MRRLFLPIASLLASLVPAFGQTSNLTSAPFVGCPADGQMGPIAAPARIERVPNVAANAAGRVAYYAAERGPGVLAPRGWSCFELYGSNGETLLVMPKLPPTDDFFRSDNKINGPVIEVARRYGGSSGRFAVAAIAARVFPTAKSYVQRVIAEQKKVDGRLSDTAADFPQGSYPDDKLNRLSDNDVEFVTPANSEGLGTYEGLAKGAEPISGLALLLPGEWPDLLLVAIRLPGDLQHLSSAIVGQARTDYSKPTH